MFEVDSTADAGRPSPCSRAGLRNISRTHVSHSTCTPRLRIRRHTRCGRRAAAAGRAGMRDQGVNAAEAELCEGETGADSDMDVDDCDAVASGHGERIAHPGEIGQRFESDLY